MKRVRHQIPQARWPSRKEAEASRLFSSVQVGTLSLSSRTWIPAMVPWRATEQGEVTESLLSWYGRFAQGQPGGIVVEATGIRDVPSGPLLRIGHNRYVPGLTSLTQRVAKESGSQTKLFVQLIDFLSVRRRPEPSKYFTKYLSITRSLRERLVNWTADAGWEQCSENEVRDFLARQDETALTSVLDERELDALFRGYRERVTDEHLAHIQNLPDVLPKLFADAAKRAYAAGFHGIELHFAHAYTMASFLSRLNTRKDGYGGSQEARVRLPLEVIAAVKSVVPKEFAVGCRFLADEIIAHGSRIEDATFYAVEFARAGLDFLSVSVGGKFEDAKQPKVGESVYPYTGESGLACMPTILSDARGPFGRNLGLVQKIRQAVRADGYNIPIVGAGGINSFEIAEQALADEALDIVAAARQSLADPDWFRKMLQGKGSEIRRCSFTNYCEGLDQKHKEVTCRLWDRQEVDAVPIQLRSWDNKRRLIAP